ncbi:MAG TPA: cyclic nucleotide-binding domain-containing protein [Tepidisphaeraceae bacterium]|nr:cyclic nucleotide-binding domain-containing protein [Tepidisphaeraceae bacterium]
MATTTIRSRVLAEVAPLPGGKGVPLSPEEVVRYDLFKDVSRNLLAKNPGSVWLRRFEPGETICRQGEYGSTAFYVQSGDVKILVSPGGPPAAAPNRGIWNTVMSMVGRAHGRAKPHPSYVPVDATHNVPRDTLEVTLGPGSLFGEMTCLSFLPRAATAVAMGHVYCLEMLRNVLFLVFDNKPQKAWRSEKRKFLRSNPGKTFDKPRPPDRPIQQTYRDRALQNDLRECPLFATIEDAAIRSLVDAADFVSIEPGEVVFHQGDPADELYLIRRGFIKVSRDDGFGSPLVMNYLSKGQYFGEIALFGGDLQLPPFRTATCAALDHVDLIVFSKQDVEQLVERYPDLRRQMKALAAQRLKPENKKAPVRSGINLESYLEQGVMQGTNMLLFDLERCTRCDECVRACADSHQGVTRLRREGLRIDKYLVPTSCRSCRDPVCLTECPVGSIGRSPGGAIIIEDWCIGCRKCEQNCPYGNIEMHLFEVEGGTKIHSQQQPVRLARVEFSPPPHFDAAGLPFGLSIDPPGRHLEYADVPGAAGEEELLAFSADLEYRRAVTELLRRVKTRVKLPLFPADFKPPMELEGVVKVRRPGAQEPEPAVEFRGVVGSDDLPAYRAASKDAAYQQAVEQAARETRGMKAVLSKASVCDLCESVRQEPNCVYACPHDAAFRVDALAFFAASEDNPSV